METNRKLKDNDNGNHETEEKRDTNVLNTRSRTSSRGVNRKRVRDREGLVHESTVSGKITQGQFDTSDESVCWEVTVTELCYL